MKIRRDFIQGRTQPLLPTSLPHATFICSENTLLICNIQNITRINPHLLHIDGNLAHPSPYIFISSIITHISHMSHLSMTKPHAYLPHTQKNVSHTPILKTHASHHTKPIAPHIICHTYIHIIHHIYHTHHIPSTILSTIHTHVLTYITTHSCHTQCIHSTRLNINNVTPATSHHYIHTQHTPHKSHTSQSSKPIKQHINISDTARAPQDITYISHVASYPIHSTCAPRNNTITYIHRCYVT